MAKFIFCTIRNRKGQQNIKVFFKKLLNATGNYRKPSDKIKVVAQMTGN